MDADRLAKIELLFHEALALDLQTRARFLDEACSGDAELKAEVESLVAAWLDGSDLKVRQVDDSLLTHGLSLGKRVGPYEVLSLVGAGGMGEVYRARDAKLRRDVALKLLPAHSADDVARASRFRREAQALGALNHPHICTVYEVGEVDGQIYIAMELVEGQPLSKLLDAGPLPYDQIIRFGFQLADALVHAHERGIVHRDLKSANVIVTPDGRCKVLDFGLAARLPDRVTEDAGPTMLTQTGDVMGTPAYMAPEQAKAGTVDGRSDIWALGVMLYQMATGNLPFQGKTSFEMLSAILNQAPTPLPSKVPIALRAVVERCLEKDPRLRYQSAAEIRTEFELIQQGATRAAAAWSHRIRRRPVLVLSSVVVLLSSLAFALNAFSIRDRVVGLISPQVDSIAVIPLRNDSGSPEQDYLSDGMTDALITELSRFSSLKNVISRTSVMTYKGSNKPTAEIARELNVRSLIEGSVVRTGDKVSVNVRLIKPTGQLLWGNRYERDFGELVQLQNEIVTSVALQLKVAMTPEERSRLARARPVDPEVYENYLKGMISLYKQTVEDVDIAYAYFQKAIEKDPGYAPAYGGLAWVWVYRGSATLPPSEVIAGFQELQKQMAAAGIDEDTSSAESFEGAADGAFFYDWNWAAAEKNFKKAVQLKPNSAEIRLFYWQFLAAMKKIPEAGATIQRALELDPKNPLAQSSYGLYLLVAEKYADAAAHFQKMIDSNTDPDGSRLGLWTAYHHLGKNNEAYQLLRSAWDAPGLKEPLEQGYKENGYKGALHRMAELLSGPDSPLGYQLPTNIAKFYAYAGDKEKALAMLKKGYDDHDSGLVMIQVDPDWKTLRNEPLFQAIVRDMKFPK